MFLSFLVDLTACSYQKQECVATGHAMHQFCDEICIVPKKKGFGSLTWQKMVNLLPGGLSWVDEESNHAPGAKSGRTLPPFSGDGWRGSTIEPYFVFLSSIFNRTFCLVFHTLSRWN